MHQEQLHPFLSALSAAARLSWLEMLHEGVVAFVAGAPPLYRPNAFRVSVALVSVRLCTCRPSTTQ